MVRIHPCPPNFEEAIMEEQLETDYSTWTSCQMYGHNYVTDEEQPNYHYCTDCDEAYFDEEQ